MKIEKAGETGFCLGVRRAVDTLEKAAYERGKVETLGDVVHNPQVLQRLADLGIRVANSVEDIKGNVVAISCHGVSPQLENKIRAKHIEIINTTCPFVRRAQIVAQRLVKAGFFVIVYGDIDHQEVKGILGWASGKGMATLDEKSVATLDPIPRHLGILSQTTQVPANFTDFVKITIDYAFIKDSEIRIIDTICHDIRRRQTDALELAKKVDLMLVVGGRNSANANRLVELCSTVTEAYLIERADEIQPSWLKGRHHIGVASGTSTSEQTIDDVLTKLKSMSHI